MKHNPARAGRPGEGEIGILSYICHDNRILRVLTSHNPRIPQLNQLHFTSIDDFCYRISEPTVRITRFRLGKAKLSQCLASQKKISKRQIHLLQSVLVSNRYILKVKNEVSSSLHRKPSCN
jgi:hypothetical protein